MTARAVQPRNADPITFLQVCNTRAERDNDSLAVSCPGVMGRAGFTGQSPSAACRSVWQTPLAMISTKAFTRPRRRYRKLSHHERLAESFNDCCSHSCRYWHTPSSLRPIIDSCPNYRVITLSVGPLMRLEHRQIEIRDIFVVLS